VRRVYRCPGAATERFATPLLLVQFADISRALIADGPVEYGLKPRHDRKGSDGLVRAQIGPPDGAGIGSGPVSQVEASGFG